MRFISKSAAPKYNYSLPYLAGLLCLLGVLFLILPAVTHASSGTSTGGGNGSVDPGVSDPGVSDPGVSDPGVSDPGVSDPGVSVPEDFDPPDFDPDSFDYGDFDPDNFDPDNFDYGDFDPDDLESGDFDFDNFDPDSFDFGDFDFNADPDSFDFGDFGSDGALGGSIGGGAGGGGAGGGAGGGGGGGGSGGSCCCDLCGMCVEEEHEDKFRQLHSPIEFEEHRKLLIEDFWYGNIVPSLMMMTEQLTVMALQQVQMLGAFFDAKIQLETELTLRKLHAQAHKDYRPSIGMCELGSAMKSLHASDARSDWTKIVLVHRAMQRNLGTVGTSAMRGREMDIIARLNQYVNIYCDPRDFNRGTIALCQGTASPRDVRNADIDWPRIVGEQGTLEIDFTVQGTPTEDEVNVFALSSYLYGHNVFTRIPRRFLETSAPGEFNILHELYLDLRSVVAKRNVAENSYAHQVAMRAEGTESAVDYLYALIEDLGVDPALIPGILGDNPSYYQQMEVLTRLIHYNPDFYVNVYESPANVLRKRVALQAIGIIQKWDILESTWRSEMLAAVAAEVRLGEHQENVQNEFGRITGEGVIRR